MIWLMKLQNWLFLSMENRLASSAGLHAHRSIHRSCGRKRRSLRERVDREVSCSLHMSHMGCSSKPEALIRQSLRTGLCDGWGGSMMGTEFSDVLFGTPKPIDTEANLGVMVAENVNIVVHGHDPVTF